MERETGIEPATNGLGSRDSTTELLPLIMSKKRSFACGSGFRQRAQTPAERLKLLPLSILIIEDSPYRINFSHSSGSEDHEGTSVTNLFQNQNNPASAPIARKRHHNLLSMT